MRVNIENYVTRCLLCAQHKGTVKGPAPILQYPPSEHAWDIVSIDLQLSQSHHSSQYLLVCVDHLSRFVVLAPLKNKTIGSIAHALVTRLFCLYSQIIER